MATKIPFKETSLLYKFDDRSSAIKNRSFVEEEIQKLVENGYIESLDKLTPFCNPLHVSEQQSGKLRLILDLSHLNQLNSLFEYEDFKSALELLEQGSYVFSFDLQVSMPLRRSFTEPRDRT